MPDTALIAIASAIAAARSGRQEEAAGMLAEAMNLPNPHRLPMGFAVQALRQGDTMPLADWVLDRAVSRGLDVTAMVPGFDALLASADAGTARRLAGRYEDAFARGAINAGMVGRYAVALSRAGEWDALAALFPARRTIMQVQLHTVEGFASLEAFNDSVIREIVDAAPRERLDGSNYMRDTMRYRALHKIDRPALNGLIALTERAFGRFATAFAPRPDSPLARMRPKRGNIAAWANFYAEGSFVEPHVHHQGWLVAVYYPRVPETADGPADAGALRVERPAGAAGAGPPWPDETIMPRPGLLVVMPAYCYHRSVPFTGAGERVAVTIDSNIDRGHGSLPFTAR